MPDRAPDGSLARWDELADRHWQLLLLGNGLSINVWEPFGYRRLFDQAAGSQLAEEDRRLFADTTNFERVLSDLSTAIRVAEAVGVNASRFYARYRSIQRALGSAVRAVHLPRARIPDATLAAIRDALAGYEWIFTTSYDLVLYWAMGYGGRFAPFKDHFRYGGRLEFDRARADVYAGDIPVYYLHGALHLVVGGDGSTWKLRQTELQTVLDQFGRPIAGDSRARPLLVTEGSAREKLRAIEGNAYLSHSLEQLRRNALPAVVFGSSLSEQDNHLVDALGQHRDRPIAVSAMPTGSKRERARQQVDVWARLDVDELHFFDATSHPLGAPQLRAD